MSYSEDYLSEHSEDWDEQGIEDQQVTAVPVHVIATNTEQVAPQFANCMTWTIPQFGASQGTQPAYTQILQKRQNRYKAKLVLTLGTATSVVLNTTPDRLTGLSTPSGFTATASGSLPDWESERPLYAVAVGGGNATIAVIDETYGQQQ